MVLSWDNSKKSGSDHLRSFEWTRRIDCCSNPKQSHSQQSWIVRSRSAHLGQCTATGEILHSMYYISPTMVSMIHSQLLYIKGTIKVLRNYPQKAIFGCTIPLISLFISNGGINFYPKFGFLGLFVPQKLL